MSTYDPREAAVQRFSRIYDNAIEAPTTEAQVRLISDDEGLTIDALLGIVDWIENGIIPALEDGIEVLEDYGYVGKAAEVRAFLGPDNALSISLSGVKAAQEESRKAPELDSTADVKVPQDAIVLSPETQECCEECTVADDEEIDLMGLRLRALGRDIPQDGNLT